MHSKVACWAGLLTSNFPFYINHDTKTHTHINHCPVSNVSSPCCSSSVPNPRDGAGHTPRSSGFPMRRFAVWEDLLTPWLVFTKKWSHPKKTHCFICFLYSSSMFPEFCPRKSPGYTYVVNTYHLSSWSVNQDLQKHCIILHLWQQNFPPYWKVVYAKKKNGHKSI